MSDESKTETGKQAALLVTGTGHPTDHFKVGDIAVPSPGPGDVHIQVRAASVNPVDWKKPAANFAMPASLPEAAGCDGSGTVIAVGEGVTEFKAGDEVWGFHLWAEPGRSWFQSSNIVRQADVYPKPDSVTHVQAATLGIAGLTACQALFHPAALGLSPPSSPTTGGEFVLVWGASSTVGQFAVQLATQAGYKVIGTASAKNHEFIRSLGAVGVVDYHDEDAVEQIKAIGLPVAAFDCASAETALKCALAINPTTGGSVVTIAGAPSEGVPENVKVLGLLVGALGEDLYSAEASAWLHKFVVSEFNPLLAAGKVKTPKIVEVEGFTGALDGVKMVAEHKVSAAKVVAKLV